MNRTIFVALLAISNFVIAEQYPSLVEMNDDLKPIYERLIASNNPSEMVGEKIELDLSLKHASEKRLLFRSTHVIVDEKTKYYFIKWKFDPEKVRGLMGKSGVRCNIRGKIIEVIKGKISPGMPYIVVQVESVQLKQALKH